MKKKIYRILFAILAVIFLGSSALLAGIWHSYRQAETEYDRLTDLAVRYRIPAVSDSGYLAETDENETAKEEVDLNRVLEIDFGILKRENPDIVGWLDIPGTPVSYPLLQANDNSYYLHRGAAKQNSSSGAIFMDSRNRPDLSDDNTVIYGHNMRNGSMFGMLQRFREKSFYQKHPYVDLYFPTGEGETSERVRFEIYSCYEEVATTENFPVVFDGEEAQNTWLSVNKRKSLYDTGIQPRAGVHTLMLSTCTGRGYSHRWVVFASSANKEPL